MREQVENKFVLKIREAPRVGLGESMKVVKPESLLVLKTSKTVADDIVAKQSLTLKNYKALLKHFDVKGPYEKQLAAADISQLRLEEATYDSGYLTLKIADPNAWKNTAEVLNKYFKKPEFYAHLNWTDQVSTTQSVAKLFCAYGMRKRRFVKYFKLDRYEAANKAREEWEDYINPDMPKKLRVRLLGSTLKKPFVTDDDQVELDIQKLEDKEHQKLLARYRKREVSLTLEVFFKKLVRRAITKEELDVVYSSKGNFDFTDPDVNTPLMVLVGRNRYARPHSIRELESDVFELIEHILKKQTRFKTKVNREDLCLLSLAALSGYYELAERLHKNYKVKFSKKSQYKCLTLIRRFADVGLFEKFLSLGFSLGEWDAKDLYRAILNGEAIEAPNRVLFLEYLNSEHNVTQDALVANREEEARFNYIYPGSTSLMRAAQSLQLDLIEYLLTKGCDLSGTDKLGNTPLKYAIYSKRQIDSEAYLAVIKALAPSVDFVLADGGKPYRLVKSGFYKDNNMSVVQDYFDHLLAEAGEKTP